MFDCALELIRSDQRTHVAPPADHRAERELFHTLDECVGEFARTRCVDEDSFGTDAELAGVRERAPHGNLHGHVEIRIREHHTRVLATEFKGVSDESLTCTRCNFTADAGGAGEHDEVAAIGDIRTNHRSLTCDQPHNMLRQSGRVQQVDCHCCGECGLQVRLQHHGVAGDDRRQEIGYRKCQRVVPRRNNADDADRMTDFAHLRHKWEHATSLLVPEQ